MRLVQALTPLRHSLCSRSPRLVPTHDAGALGVRGDIDGLLKFFGEDAPLGYDNARVAQLLEAAQNTDHPDEMDEIFRGPMEVFAEELPFTYLVLNVETCVANRRVKGMSTPFRANPLWSVEHLWLEDQRRRIASGNAVSFCFPPPIARRAGPIRLVPAYGIPCP